VDRTSGSARPWREAWAASLYGADGFYARGEAPAAHFRTSVHASPLFAGAVLELLRRVDRALGGPDPVDLADVGAGRGELLAAVAAAADPPLRARLRLTAVEVGPVDLPGVRVVRDVTELPELTGLLVANEWLDDVPLDLVEQTAAGPRVVLVSPTGAESMGDPPAGPDAAWLARWWPLDVVGHRAEVGRSRDEAWAAVVGRLTRGVAVAVDYVHEAGRRPPEGTLTGYRAGRQVQPVPNGSCDLTAHVALDAVAAAGVAAGATETRLDDQRAALQALGVDARRPPRELASTDPAAYLRALQRAGEAAELIDRGGLGAFGWLVQGVGVPLPFPPLATRARVRRKPAEPPG
jgi:SAM-dependent MidA family methyltransferase